MLKITLEHLFGFDLWFYYQTLKGSAIVSEKQMLLTLDMLVDLINEYVEEIEVKDLEIALLKKHIERIERKEKWA